MNNNNNDVPNIKSKEVISLKQLDQAFSASLLSQAVYVDNIWAMENIKTPFPELGKYIQKGINSQQDMARLKLWNYLHENFEPVSSNSVRLSAMQDVNIEEPTKFKQENYNFTTEYSFKNGQYSAGSKYHDLAHAALLTSEDPDNPGKKILHVSFRGTEFSRIKEFIPHAYMDMDAYYHHFKPLEAMIKEYASNPANKVSQIHASGHSLGGAMAEEFLKRMPDDPDAGYTVKGFTFGSPGSTKKPLMKFLTTAYHVLREKIIPDHTINQSVLDEKEKQKDPRLVNFYHSNDPVPKLGIAGYSKSGKSLALEDKFEVMSQQVGFTKKTFLEKWPLIGNIATFFTSKRYHNSDRYSINLRDQIEGRIRKSNIQDVNGDNVNVTNEWKKFAKSEISFQSLAIKYKNAFEILIAHDEPGISKENIQKKLYEIRDNMKHDSKVQVAMNKIGNTKGIDHLLTNPNSPQTSEETKAFIAGRFGHPSTMDLQERVQRLEKLREAIATTDKTRQFKNT